MAKYNFKIKIVLILDLWKTVYQKVFLRASHCYPIGKVYMSGSFLDENLLWLQSYGLQFVKDRPNGLTINEQLLGEYKANTHWVMTLTSTPGACLLLLCLMFASITLQSLSLDRSPPWLVKYNGVVSPQLWITTDLLKSSSAFMV